MKPNIQYGKSPVTIKRILNKKLHDWISSITDREVASIAKDNAIVTGGAIASLLLGETVNDYDIYFKTKDAANVIAQYYASQYQKLQDEANGVSESDTPNEEKIPYIDVIVGEDRVTFFNRSVRYTGDLKKLPKYSPIFFSQNAITLTDAVQIITRFYGDVTEIHKNFDFVHATCSFDYKTNTLHTPVEALQSLLSRNLSYCGSLYPVASIFRMKKFLQRGWRINAGQQLKIMMQINSLDLKNLDVFKEQMTGVDISLLNAIVMAVEKEQLKHEEAESYRVSFDYVSTLIDRFFGDSDDDADVEHSEENALFAISHTDVAGAIDLRNIKDTTDQGDVGNDSDDDDEDIFNW